MTQPVDEDIEAKVTEKSRMKMPNRHFNWLTYIGTIKGNRKVVNSLPFKRQKQENLTRL